MCVQRSSDSFVRVVPRCLLFTDTIRNGFYTDNSVVVSRGKGGGWTAEKGKGDQICGDERRLDSGWSKHTVMYNDVL